MNMPPVPSHMHKAYNPDARNLRQVPGTPDINQGMMRGQQEAQGIRARAEDRVQQGTVAMNEEVRGANMNMNSQQAHADTLALNTKANILEALGMKGVPLDGMRGVRAAAVAAGYIV